MSGFKLLAIRPLEGCDEKYRKNLIPGQIYQFYQDYQFEISKDEEGKEVVSAKPLETNVPMDLYNIRRKDKPDLKINISAIVGKNGSGKSSLLEIIYGTIYLLGEQEELFDDESSFDEANRLLLDAKDLFNKHKKFKEETELEWYKNFFEDITINLEGNSEYLKLNEDKYKRIRKLFERTKPDNYEELINIRQRTVDSFNHIHTGLKTEIYFEIDSVIYVIRVNNDEKQVSITPIHGLSIEDYKKKELSILQTFFYSIAVNYSIHGLNDRTIGSWINPLFHKNDGYQTPLVINPMRTHGDFKIEREEYLAKSRLLSNLLLNDEKNEHRKLTDKQIATHLIFTLNKEKIGPDRLKTINEDTLKDRITKQIQSELYGTFNINIDLINIPFKQEIENYILNKIEKILYVYKPYEKTYTNNLARFRDVVFDTVIEEKIPQLINALYTDDSHITFKLRQAINYLKNGLLENVADKIEWEFGNHKYLLESWNDKDQYVISIESLSDKLAKKTNDRLINLIPPSLFDIEIILTDDKSLSSFKLLSSGEQQHIHSIQSILYHLYNIDSVFNQPDHSEIVGTRFTYPNINIVLDEIELYFHPEFQRRFVSDLLKSIGRLNLGKNDAKDNFLGINSINILFATHSPFILSDIPSQNVLRLENGIPSNNEQKGTFGANIHEMLNDNFFLDKGAMGEFAKTHIEDIAKEIIDSNFIELKKVYELSKKIEIIEEPLIKERLEFLLAQKSSLKSKDEIIAELKQEIQGLKNKS
ncbi:MAG: AAA family ATPase [Flavobacteriia bacterium]|nr:AAA family ATPase [Flavobacteriia bacterium]OJX36635.1 MAG: hypothetical protein BGO87_12610 [Flavobacteriia bacterium 40-80]